MTGITPEQVANLAAPFPPESVHWRAQTVTERAGKHSALALAYLDARDVQDRLDSVCGPENWEDSYIETPKGRIIGTIRVRIGDDWISKSDGAGDTDVEGEKGALSDAMKRAAVKWGIGRYLYSLPNVWVPCEVGNNGKFRKFTDDPWKHVRGFNPPPPPKPTPEPESVSYITDDQRDLIMTLAPAAEVSIQTICEGYNISDLRELPASKFPALIKRLEGRPDETRKAA
jgi:hypothetical protein